MGAGPWDHGTMGVKSYDLHSDRLNHKVGLELVTFRKKERYTALGIQRTDGTYFFLL